MWWSQLSISGAGALVARPCSVQGFAGAGHCKIAVTNALEGGQTVGEFLHLQGLAAYDYHLQAVVVVHVDMGGGDDLVMVVMLDQGNLFLELMLVMVIDQTDNPHDLLVGLPLFLDEGLANQIANRLGAVIVTAGLDMCIKNIQQLFFKLYGKSFQHV